MRTKRKQTLTIYLTCIWIDREWVRVGNLYRNRGAAMDWLRFAKLANRASRGKIVKVLLPLVEPGKTTAAAASLLREKYLVSVDCV